LAETAKKSVKVVKVIQKGKVSHEKKSVTRQSQSQGKVSHNQSQYKSNGEVSKRQSFISSGIGPTSLLQQQERPWQPIEFFFIDHDVTSIPGNFSRLGYDVATE
jgi:hypothetical protein